MINWNSYISEGNFKSKNGIYLPFKYEFDKLEQNKNDIKIILSKILELCKNLNIIAIETLHPKVLINYVSGIYRPKENILYTNLLINNPKKYVIYDDVITTGKTDKDCINLIKTNKYKIKGNPTFCLCIVDRRKESNVNHLINEKVISLKEVLK